MTANCQDFKEGGAGPVGMIVGATSNLVTLSTRRFFEMNLGYFGLLASNSVLYSSLGQ